MSGMMALCLILGIMAALGGTWLVPDEADDEMDMGTTLTGMWVEMDIGDDAMCEMMIADSDDAECDGSVYTATTSFSDMCDDDPDDNGDACDMATGGIMGTIGMWAGVVCALMVTLMLVLPMAGIDAMDAMPDMGKMITSWGAGGLMLLGIIGWWMMRPEDVLDDFGNGMSFMMGIGAALLGLAAAAMDQFMPADE